MKDVRRHCSLAKTSTTSEDQGKRGALSNVTDSADDQRLVCRMCGVCNWDNWVHEIQRNVR